jgi:hypothetical protein
MVKLLSHRGNNELMQVNKRLYNGVSSCVFSEFALIPLRQIFRFVHWFPFLTNRNAQIFDLVRHLQPRVSFSLNEEGVESHYLDAMNEENVNRFKEFRDWFGGLRSVRLQIGFRGGKFEVVEEEKKNVVRRIMRRVDVFRPVGVLHFVKRTERKEGDASAYEEIIGECERQIGGKEI